MPDLFDWKPEYSVSVSTFDMQHKKLLQLASNLHQTMREGRARSVLSDLLSQLVTYTRTHFRAEEEILDGNRYPELQRHREEHLALLVQVENFQKEFAAGNAHISIELMEFLRNWIANHILQTDSRYANYLNTRGVY